MKLFEIKFRAFSPLFGSIKDQIISESEKDEDSFSYVESLKDIYYRMTHLGLVNENTLIEIINTSKINESNNDLDSPSKTAIYEDKIHVCAPNIGIAVEQGIMYLGANFESPKKGFMILSVSEMTDIAIINWGMNFEGYDEDNNNSEYFYELAKDQELPVEDKLLFHCNTCDNELLVADGWKTINCRYCGDQIERSSLFYIGNGKYMVLKDDIKGGKNTKNDSDKDKSGE